jgi:uncharacterized membrane protein YedE/YeeE
MKLATAYLFGLVFGIGIALSGMMNPAKVLNFFDLAGTWDPSLVLVMAGAVAVTAVGYRMVFGRGRPVLDDRFHLPKASAVDLRLVGGSALFGVGWGLSGFCPGGVLPAVGTGRADVLVFVAAMLAGILAARALLDRRTVSTAAARRA